MSINYYKYCKYKDLEFSFLEIFEKFKNLVTLFYLRSITFEEYYIHLKHFYVNIKERDELIKFILNNYTNHDSNHVRKIDFFSQFLHSNNIYIPKYQQKNFLSRTNEENATEKMIVKHTNNKEFVIDYLSSMLAEQLEYKTSDLIGSDIHKFMPKQMIEFHYPHIVKHLKKNSLLIRTKEIYFISRSGYALNYIVDGSILLTLNGEILIYVEVHPVNLQYKSSNISFLSCDEEGELIAMNRQFTENFYIDVNVLNYVQPNLLKNILILNKENAFFTNSKTTNLMVIKYNYFKLIKNIRGLDYSKLWDYNDQAYFTYIKSLNSNKYIRMEKVQLTIEITKRNLQEKFFFMISSFF